MGMETGHVESMGWRGAHNELLSGF